MNLPKDLRGFLRAFFHPGSRPKAPRASDSMVRTLRESTHVRGSDGGLGRASTEAQQKIVVQGHENYTASFKKNT